MTRDEQRRIVIDAIHDNRAGTNPEVHELSEEAQKELWAMADAVLDSLVQPPIHAYTPREGLLMVLEIVNGVQNGGMSVELRDRIKEAATAGLTGREDFLTTDRLAERLADAHHVCMLLANPGITLDLAAAGLGPEDIEEIDRLIPGVVNLPPDLEPMIERHEHRPG